MTAEKKKLLESEAIGDFLKSVYMLHDPDTNARVPTNALAERLKISAPSVTDMARRMEEQGYVDYVKYYGVRLTDKGEHIALQLIRRHRLIELYLVEMLDYALHEVHEEAERLEHVVSERFIEAIYEKLGQPLYDPHGDPIPTRDGTLISRRLTTLAEFPLHTPGQIARYDTRSDEMIAHIAERGFKINAPVEVIARDPFNGPLTVRLHAERVVIGHSVALAIMISPDDPANYPKNS